MEEATQAFVFFWLAGLFLLAVHWSVSFPKLPCNAKSRACDGFCGASVAHGHALDALVFSVQCIWPLAWALIGPAVLLGVGFYQITFAGNVPVGGSYTS